MWIPGSWDELEAAIDVQIEAVDLDFKRELAGGNKVRDIAKDVAAMAIEGGVIVVGMNEQEGVASGITPVDLKQAAERIQQVIDGNVRPPLRVEIRPIRKNDGDDDGVLVITVPRSWSTPHQYDGRYPARAGSTTRNLEEREIESLYRRRAELRAVPPGGFGVVNHICPPGVDGGIEPGVGLLTMHVRPAGDGHHPAEPHLRVPLREAAGRAAENMGEFVGHPYPVRALEDLRSWNPAGPGGWQAGRFLGGLDALIGGGPAVGAMYRSGNGFSFTVTMALTPDEPGPWIEGEREPPKNLCVFEQLWTVEMLGLLRIAGQLFAPLPEASLLRVDLTLGGLLGAKSFQATEGMRLMSDAPHVIENLYPAGGHFPSRQLADDPRDAVRELLDPFMVAILNEGSDMVEMVGP